MFHLWARIREWVVGGPGSHPHKGPEHEDCPEGLGSFRPGPSPGESLPLGTHVASRAGLTGKDRFPFRPLLMSGSWYPETSGPPHTQRWIHPEFRASSRRKVLQKIDVFPADCVCSVLELGLCFTRGGISKPGLIRVALTKRLRC